MTAVGSRPAWVSTWATSDVVVVFPWLPATAMPLLSAVLAGWTQILGDTTIVALASELSDRASLGSLLLDDDTGAVATQGAVLLVLAMASHGLERASRRVAT